MEKYSKHLWEQAPHSKFLCFSGGTAPAETQAGGISFFTAVFGSTGSPGWPLLDDDKGNGMLWAQCSHRQVSGVIGNSHHQVSCVPVSCLPLHEYWLWNWFAVIEGMVLCKKNNVEFKTSPFIIYASIVPGQSQQQARAVWMILSISDLVRTFPDSFQQLNHLNLRSQVL